MLIAIKDITVDLALQPRAAGHDEATIDEYVDAILAGATFPDVVIYKDSKDVLWLSEGFGRYVAHQRAGKSKIAAEIRKGSRSDALLNAAASNQTHGMRRTNADKRRAVEMVLGEKAEWSDRKIAEQVGVTHPTVAAIRAEVVNLSTRGGQLDAGRRKYSILSAPPASRVTVRFGETEAHAEILRKDRGYLWVKFDQPIQVTEIPVPAEWAEAEERGDAA